MVVDVKHLRLSFNARLMWQGFVSMLSVTSVMIELGVSVVLMAIKRVKKEKLNLYSRYIWR